MPFRLVDLHYVFDATAERRILTTLANPLLEPVGAVVRWAENHYGRILTAREHFNGKADAA